MNRGWKGVITKKKLMKRIIMFENDSKYYDAPKSIFYSLSCMYIQISYFKSAVTKKSLKICTQRLE